MDLFEGHAYVRSGYLYLPLMVDKEIIEEQDSKTDVRFNSLSQLERIRGTPNIIEDEGVYVKSIRLESLVDIIERDDPDRYESIRNDLLSSVMEDPQGLDQIVKLDSRVNTIVFEVLPYFVRTGGIEKRKLSERELVEKIRGSVDIPTSFDEKASDFLNSRYIDDKIDALDSIRQENIELAGHVSSRDLTRWLRSAVCRKIIKDEKEKLVDEIKNKRALIEKHRDYVSTLLYLSECDSFSLQDFGFYRHGREYVIYITLEPYELRDFKGTRYSFPSCMIGTLSADLKHPFVVGQYKHPFLSGFDSNQPICIRKNMLKNEFDAENIVASLEAGAATILYGYINREDFNGYHSLSEEQFEEYRK